jgi:predicted transcriptional regulator
LNTHFISKPHFSGLDTLHLHYVDILTYVTIRSFRNPDNYNCYPGYETIAKRMGASKSFVMDSVKRLECSGYMRIHKIAYLSNQYYFTPFDITDRVPTEFFNLDLTIYEKAMLLVIRQFCVGLPHITFSSIKQISINIGVSYKTIHKQVTSLIEKGFVRQRVMKNTGEKDGFDISPMIDWLFKYDRNDNEENDKQDYRLMIT